MVNENCVLLSNATDLQLVIDRLNFVFGADAYKIEGQSNEWSSLSITRRKLFRQATVRFEPLDAMQLGEIQKRLQHVYKSIPADNPKLLTKLLAKIGTSRLAIDVQAERGLRGLEDAVFAIAEALDAIIFWEGSKMLDKQGHLLMDFEGKSGVSDLEVVVDATEFDASTPLSATGIERKARTEAFLKEKKVAFSKSLPPIEGEENVHLRSIEEVAGRCLALMIVAAKAEGLEDDFVVGVVEHYEIAQYLSPEERAFLDEIDPEQQQRINFLWRYESLWTFLWCLGFIENLPFPDEICDVPRAVQIIQSASSHQAFLDASKLRTTSEILDQCDLAYRLHWAVVDGRMRSERPPADIEAGVVYERHYALNWLRNYRQQAWDDVATDT